MQPTGTITIDGIPWLIGEPRGSGAFPLIPATPYRYGSTNEGGTLSCDGRLAALPDDVTNAVRRNHAIDFAYDKGGHQVVTLSQRFGVANVWLRNGPDWDSALSVPDRAVTQRAVLRVLAGVPGVWVCNNRINANAGWRFGSAIHLLRKTGYPIETDVCNTVLHTHHKSPVGATRLPGADLEPAS